LPALARAELEPVLKETSGRLARVADSSSIAQVHLKDIKTRVEHALDPIPSLPSQRPTPGVILRRGAEDATERY
jgi:hypothetical protein